MDSIKSGVVVFLHTMVSWSKRTPVTMSAKTIQQVRPVETARAWCGHVSSLLAINRKPGHFKSLLIPGFLNWFRKGLVGLGRHSLCKSNYHICYYFSTCWGDYKCLYALSKHQMQILPPMPNKQSQTVNRCQSQTCSWNLNWDMDFTLNQKACLNYRGKSGVGPKNGFNWIA